MDTLSLQQKHTTSTIAELLDKYHNDPYMQAKLHNYVCIQLPTIMENIKRTHEERQQRIADLTVEQDEFIERFLNMHRYFYVSTTEKFVSYDGKKYEITAEDNILHHILTTITSEKQLMDWKQRTKVYIMKRIKDNTLLKSVPESETIQRVLDHLYPALFETKCDAKYFLTIIGDGLFRKNSDVVHFIQPKAKAFLREISNSSLYMFGINTTHTFKYKYYAHNYSQCRLVKINDSVENDNIWGNILRNVSLDMLCVAAHYSIRHGSADEYVARFSNDPTLETYAFFLRNISEEQLVCRFIDEYLQVSLNGTTQYVGVSPSGTPPNASNLLLSLSSPFSYDNNKLVQSNPIRDCSIPGARNERSEYTVFPERGTSVVNGTTRQISWKNMHYLWRHFLESLQLPPIIFQQNLKNILTLKLAENYKEDTDSFIGVSSRFMPAIRSFIYFWETTISNDENGEYEIDELCMLYKRWLSVQHPIANTHLPSGTPYVSGLKPYSKPDGMMSIGGSREFGGGSGTLTEKQMVDLITYYFPNADMERDKYVYNIRCSLWDKQMDIETALTQLKESLCTNITEPDAIAKNSVNEVMVAETAKTFSYDGKPSKVIAPIYATTVYDAYVWYCKYYSDITTDDPITAFVPPYVNSSSIGDDKSSTLLGSGSGSGQVSFPTSGVLPTERRKPRMNGKRPIVSKSYFEKYLNDTIAKYVVDGKYILREWIFVEST